MTNEPEEELVLVDPEGSPIGTAPRARCHGDPSLLHAVVHVVVRDPEGRLLLQKRSAEKDVQPGKWDTAVGGHLSPGEIPLDAAIRETHEELGILLPAESFRFCYAYRHTNPVESEHVRTYRVEHGGPFAPSPEEIADLCFWTREEIRSAFSSGRLTPNCEEEFHRFEAYERDAAADRG
jgi:isopentenyldiphosphate isomerase